MTLDFTRKKVQSLFFIRKVVFFFRKVLFNNLLDSLNFALITSAVKVKLPRGLLHSVLWDLSYSITRLYEKKAKIFFSLERLPFFSKIYVSKKPLRCYRSDIITSTVIVRIPSVPLQTVPWGLSHSIIQKKTDQNTFLLERLLFFQKFVFNNLWDSQNFVLITSAVIVRLPRGPLKSVPWGLSYSIKREKTGQIFVSGQKAFFEKFGSQIHRS